ncbi:uncharacterized protein LOC105662990 [Megachile rotundata]|uniref:uncharacterized protein LOC105662990 n=1 Tax=Megachile rotundata TaxID=143995 RepID=UPI000614AEA4|nr:PREDICTED: uncharacterized protein LOC105662990 [Megachile rotundata]
MRSSSINMSLSMTFMFVLFVSQFLITVESRTTGSWDNGRVVNTIRNRDKSNEDEDRIIFKDDDDDEQEGATNVRGDFNNAKDDDSDTLVHKSIIGGTLRNTCNAGYKADDKGQCRKIEQNFPE